jgi:predicted nucleic acid-binding protein
LNFGGPPLHFLERAADGEFQLACSEAIVAEVVRVLGLKFHWTVADVNRAEKTMVNLAAPLRAPVQKIDAIPEDPSGNMVLECAMDAGCGYIVSGDKHLLRLRAYEEVKVVRVADFLRVLDQDRGA